MMQIILSPQINDFLIILFSIVVEGIPFIMLGAVLSAIIENYLSQEKVLKLIPKNKAAQLAGMSMLGMIFPVCECGNIPFARRLISKNTPHYMALTFLLAAPTLNPLVIVATIAAFPNNPEITWLRVLFSLIIAIGGGYLFSLLKKEQVLRETHGAEDHPHDHDHDHDHNHKHEGNTCCATPPPQAAHHQNSKSKLLSVLSITGKELLELGAIFLFGAILASTIQIFLPKDFVLAFNNQEWLSILAMMTLAFIVSICSNVDAFFALSYAQIFPTSSILAFLTFGPMMDIKAIPMLKTIFNWKGIALIISYTALSTFLLSYIYFLIS